jgi:hypothetical protein
MVPVKMAFNSFNTPGLAAKSMQARVIKKTAYITIGYTMG